jgi:signal transduction histidine kinase
MARRTLLITYIATYLLAVGMIIRTLVRFQDDRFWSLALLLGGYLVLLFIEPVFIRRHRNLTYIYLVVQTAIICTVALITPEVDFWAVLFCPLVVQVMHNSPQRSGFFITGIFTVIASILLLLGLGPQLGLPLILIYGVIYFLLAAFIAIIREVETSNEEIHRQQAELQAAHRQLQSSTAQAEQLAVLQERNRLARELHDSVTQSLYSLTLFSEAARHMAEDIGEESIEQYIGQIGVIGQQALKEMRLLVYELQPLELEREGLIRALRKRLEAVEGRAGVEARLEVDDFVNLPGDVEGELYRIAQEALNNSLKHAAAGSVVLYLRQSNGSVELEIVDDGVGFNPEALPDRGGMGLKSIRDRAEHIGGSATIRSQPGEGTSVKVSLQQISVHDQRPETGPKS